MMRWRRSRSVSSGFERVAPSRPVLAADEPGRGDCFVGAALFDESPSDRIPRFSVKHTSDRPATKAAAMVHLLFILYFDRLDAFSSRFHRCIVRTTPSK